MSTLKDALLAVKPKLVGAGLFPGLEQETTKPAPTAVVVGQQPTISVVGIPIVDFKPVEVLPPVVAAEEPVETVLVETTISEPAIAEKPKREKPKKVQPPVVAVPILAEGEPNFSRLIICFVAPNLRRLIDPSLLAAIPCLEAKKTAGSTVPGLQFLNEVKLLKIHEGLLSQLLAAGFQFTDCHWKVQGVSQRLYFTFDLEPGNTLPLPLATPAIFGEMTKVVFASGDGWKNPNKTCAVSLKGQTKGTPVRHLVTLA